MDPKDWLLAVVGGLAGAFIAAPIVVAGVYQLERYATRRARRLAVASDVRQLTKGQRP